jgi:hypothetical protein
MCNRFINDMANFTLMMHVMSHRAKSVTPLTIEVHQNFLNRMVVDSPRLGRDDYYQDDTPGNGVGHGNGK